MRPLDWYFQADDIEKIKEAVGGYAEGRPYEKTWLDSIQGACDEALEDFGKEEYDI